MKIFGKYINFSKLLIFALVVLFFAMLVFDGYAVVRLMNMIENGVDLMYATVIGTVISIMSSFASAVILIGVRSYYKKAEAENIVGYDSESNTISTERMGMNIDVAVDDEGGGI